MQSIEKMLVPTSLVKGQIKDLVLVCDQADGTVNVPYVDNAFNLYPDMNSIYLCYKEMKLIGFISVYADDEVTAELLSFVLPEERRRGVFNSLLRVVKEELLNFNYQEIVFKGNVKFEHHAKLVKRFRGHVDNKEYFMCTKFPNSVACISERRQEIKVAYAKEQELNEIAPIVAEAFDCTEAKVIHDLKETLRIPINKVVVIKKQEKIVGTANIEIGESYSHIFGLCVASQYRGKGIGRQGLYEIVRKIQEEVPQPFSLEVEKSNERALKLYEDAGFQVVSEFHYCELPLKK